MAGTFGMSVKLSSGSLTDLQVKGVGGGALARPYLHLR